MNTILLDIENNVARITFNRPDVRHAFDDVMITELLSALNTIAADDTIRAVVLRSIGPVFCAGADLTWMQKMLKYSLAENEVDASQLAQLMYSLYTLNKPTIVLVQGHAYGGGVGLIACCDIAIASSKAQFCFSEVKLGLSPSVISPYVIRAIGPRQTQRYFLTAESFDATTALQLGLIHALAADEEELNTQAESFIQRLLKNGPKALTSTKNLLQYNVPLSTELVNYTIKDIAKLRISAEGQAGIQAFLANHPPDWIRS